MFVCEGRCKVQGVMLRQLEKIELSVVLGTNHKERKVTVYRPIVQPGQVAGEASAKSKQECTLSHQRQECYSLQGRYLATLVVHEWLSRASPGLASWSPDAQWALKYLPNILYIWSDYKPINHYCSNITCRKLLIYEVQEIKKICKVAECNRIVANKCIQLGFMCKPELWGTQPNLFTWCKRLVKVAQRISTYCNQNLQAI